MPRVPRVSIENILYYITSIAASGRKLFNDRHDYYAYLEFLKRSKEENNFKLFAWTLLPGHLHLLIELKPGANISDIMQNLHTAYTKYYNSRYKRKGSVFQQRYKVIYVEKKPNLLELTKYIHLNSQRLKLVESFRDYKYSSYPVYMYPEQMPDNLQNLIPDIKEEIKEIFDNIKGTDQQGGYARFISAGDEEKSEYLHKALSRGSFLGSDEFIKHIKKEIEIRSEEKKEKEAEEIIGPRPARRSFIWTGSIAILILGGIAGYLYIKNWKQEEQYQNRLQQQELEFRQKLRQQLAEVEERLKEQLTKPVIPPRTNTVDIMELDGSVWKIKLTLVTGQGAGTVYPDVLTFRNNQISSSRFLSQGYPLSNYSLTEQPDGAIVWETMQTAQDGRTATWHGEWKGDTMRGILSEQISGQKPHDFSFISTSHTLVE